MVGLSALAAIRRALTDYGDTSIPDDTRRIKKGESVWTYQPRSSSIDQQRKSSTM